MILYNPAGMYHACRWGGTPPRVPCRTTSTATGATRGRPPLECLESSIQRLTNEESIAYYNALHALFSIMYMQHIDIFYISFIYLLYIKTLPFYLVF